MNGWLLFFCGGWGSSFTVYVGLQIGALLTLRGSRWIAAPAVPALIIVIATISAYQSGANLWPIWLIFGSPLLSIAVTLLWAAGLGAAHRNRGEKTALLVGFLATAAGFASPFLLGFLLSLFG